MGQTHSRFPAPSIVFGWVGKKPDTRAGYDGLEKAARKGAPYAQRLMGNTYEQDVGDMKRDYAHAAQYDRDAAGLLDWPAPVALGRLTLRSQDKPQGKAQGARWWKAAADAGDAVGMHNLGVAYLKGNGVSHSGEEAMKWFGKASVAGHGEALKGFKEAYRVLNKSDAMLPGKILELARAVSLDAMVEMSTRG